MTNLAEKLPFPIARQSAIEKILELDNSEFLSMSNNILAIEYLKELLRIDSNIEAVSILRKAVDHNSIEAKGNFKSATSIRKSLYNVKETISKRYREMDTIEKFEEEKILGFEKYLPSTSVEVIKKNFSKDIYPIYAENFFDELCYSILREEENLEQYFEVNEGIENSIRKNITTSYNFEELVEELTSARYSSSRIRRTLFNILLGIYKDDMKEIRRLKALSYIRVLAFNKKGTEILKEIKNKSNALIIKSPAKAKKSDEYRNDAILKKMFDFDIKSSNIYYQKYYSQNRSILKKGEPDFVTLGYML